MFSASHVNLFTIQVNIETYNILGRNIFYANEYLGTGYQLKGAKIRLMQVERKRRDYHSKLTIKIVSKKESSKACFFVRLMFSRRFEERFKYNPVIYKCFVNMP